MSVWVCVCLCLPVYLSVCLCLSMCLPVSVFICVCMCLPVSVSVCMCICACLHMCVFACVSVCLRWIKQAVTYGFDGWGNSGKVSAQKPNWVIQIVEELNFLQGDRCSSISRFISSRSRVEPGGTMPCCTENQLGLWADSGLLKGVSGPLLCMFSLLQVCDPGVIASFPLFEGNLMKMLTEIHCMQTQFVRVHYHGAHPTERYIQWMNNIFIKFVNGAGRIGHCICSQWCMK